MKCVKYIEISIHYILTVLNGFGLSRFFNKYELLLRMINQFRAEELMMACAGNRQLKRNRISTRTIQT